MYFLHVNAINHLITVKLIWVLVRSLSLSFQQGFPLLSAEAGCSHNLQKPEQKFQFLFSPQYAFPRWTWQINDLTPLHLRLPICEMARINAGIDWFVKSLPLIHLQITSMFWARGLLPGGWTRLYVDLKRAFEMPEKTAKDIRAHESHLSYSVMLEAFDDAYVSSSCLRRTRWESQFQKGALYSILHSKSQRPKTGG